MITWHSPQSKPILRLIASITILCFSLSNISFAFPASPARFAESRRAGGPDHPSQLRKEQIEGKSQAEKFAADFAKSAEELTTQEAKPAEKPRSKNTSLTRKITLILSFLTLFSQSIGQTAFSQVNSVNAPIPASSAGKADSSVAVQPYDIVSPREKDSLGGSLWKNYLNRINLLSAWVTIKNSPYEKYAKVKTINSIDSVGSIPPRYSEGEIRSERGIENLINNSVLDEHTAIILDSGGAHNVAMAVRLIKQGYQPVIMLDGIPHPDGKSKPEQGLATLLYFAAEVDKLREEGKFNANSPPVFILDVHRDGIGPGFDNTYKYVLADFPSGEELKKYGITKIVYVNETDKNGLIQPSFQSVDRLRPDLKPVAEDWEKAGIKILDTGVQPWKDENGRYEFDQLPDSSQTNIGKNARFEKKVGNTAKVRDSKGVSQDIELTPFKIEIKAIKSQIENAKNLNKSQKKIILAKLALLEKSPPNLYTYSKLVEDLLAFASPDDNLIAFHQSLANDPIAIFHEVMEYLVKEGEIKLKLLNNNAIIITDKAGNGLDKIALTRQDALEQLEKARVNPEFENHYYLRAIQREQFGEEDSSKDADKELTRKIEEEQRKTAPNRAPGKISLWVKKLSLSPEENKTRKFLKNKLGKEDMAKLEKEFSDIIDLYGYLPFKKLYDAAGKNAWSLFEDGLPTVKDLFSEQEFKTYWPDLVELGVAAGESARFLFKAGLPVVKNLITDRESLNAVGSDLVKLDTAVGKGKNTWHLFKDDLRAIKNLITEQEFKTCWPDLVESFLSLYQNTNDYNRQRLLELFRDGYLEFIRENSVSPFNLLDFYNTVIQKEPRLSLQILEGTLDGLKRGIIDKNLPDEEKEQMFSFINLTHSFSPALFKLYKQEGKEGLKPIFGFAQKILSDNVGPEELANLRNFLVSKSIKDEEIQEVLVSSIQLAIPSSGASFVKKNEIQNLFEKFEQAGDRREDIPPNLWNKNFGDDSVIELVEYKLKEGQQYDPEGRIKDIVNQLHYPDAGLSDTVKQDKEQQDKTALIGALSQWFEDFTSQDKKQATLKAFYGWASHIDALKEKIEAISGDYQGASLLEHLFMDKDNLSVLIRGVLKDEMPTSKLPQVEGKMLYDAGNLAKQINSIWNLNITTKDKKEKISLIINRFSSQEIRSKLTPLISDDALRDTILTLDSLKKPISYADIIQELFIDPLTVIQTEKAKFAPRKTGEVALEFRVVKGIPYGLWGLNAGVCVATDLELWKNKNFMLLAIIDKNSNKACGFVHLFEVDINGKRVLTLPSINPSVEFLSEVKAATAYLLTEKAINRLAVEGGYDAVYIPTDSNLSSNRSDIREIINKKYFAHKLTLNEAINWNTLPKPYPFNEVYVVWEKKSDEPAIAEPKILTHPFQQAKLRTHQQAVEQSNFIRRSEEIRSHCKKIKQIVDDNNLLEIIDTKILRDNPDLKPIKNVREPRDRLLTLYNGVGDIVKEAAGQGFDLVIYPASGSDITAGFSYADTLVTIDRNDLFNLKAKYIGEEMIKSKIKIDLTVKLKSSIYNLNQTLDLTNYALELILLGADLDSIKVIDEKTISAIDEINPPLIMTAVEFKIKGKTFTHIHFRHYLEDKFDETDPRDQFLQNKLFKLIEGKGNIILLSKAGGGLAKKGVVTHKSVDALYPILKNGAVIVTDYILNDHRKLEHMEDTKIVDLKNQDIINKLRDLQGEIPPAKFAARSPNPYLIYGYARGLANGLGIFRITRAPIVSPLLSTTEPNQPAVPPPTGEEEVTALNQLAQRLEQDFEELMKGADEQRIKHARLVIESFKEFIRGKDGFLYLRKNITSPIVLAKTPDDKEYYALLQEAFEIYNQFSEKDKAILYIAVILHDIGYTETRKAPEHITLGVKKVEPTLRKYGLTDADIIAKVKNLVRDHGKIADFGLVTFPADFKDIPNTYCIQMLMMNLMDTLGKIERKEPYGPDNNLSSQLIKEWLDIYKNAAAVSQEEFLNLRLKYAGMARVFQLSRPECELDNSELTYLQTMAGKNKVSSDIWSTKIRNEI